MPSLLKTKNKKSDKEVYLGVNITPKIHSMMSLHCSAKAITKTTFINRVLEKWAIEQKKADVDYIQEISLRVFTIWELDHRKKRGRRKHKDFEEFCELISVELLSKGVKEDVAERIIREVKIKVNDKKSKKKKGK
jgi:hypothetical protein